MPDRETIGFKLLNLKSKPMGPIANDQQIWEGTQYNAHFKVTREPVPTEDRPRLAYFLSISGLYFARTRVAQDFKLALGAPVMEDLSQINGQELLLLSWWADEAENRWLFGNKIN
jgi:hypothetical protein